MKKRIFAVAAALCLMAGTGAFAQEAKPAAAPKERPTVEQMAQLSLIHNSEPTRPRRIAYGVMCV